MLPCQIRIATHTCAVCRHMLPPPLVSMPRMLLYSNTLCRWRVDPTACHTLGVRESQMPNTSPTSAKTGDQEATRGKVIKQTSVYRTFVQTSSCTIGKWSPCPSLNQTTTTSCPTKKMVWKCVHLDLMGVLMFPFSAGNLSSNRKKLKGKKFRARSNSTE